MIGEEIVEVSLGLAGHGQVKVGIDGYCLVMVVAVVVEYWEEGGKLRVIRRRRRRSLRSGWW